MRPYCVFDTEAVAIEGVEAYLDPVVAPANYKDPLKIAAYQEEQRQARIERAALDIDLARIVALMYDLNGTLQGGVCVTEADERDRLQTFVDTVLRPWQDDILLVGFNCLQYDLPLILRRCQLHGIAVSLDLQRYRNSRIVDVMQALSFNGLVKPHSLQFYARRFGIDTSQMSQGCDVAATWAAGHYTDVLLHCEEDVALTRELALRLRLIHLVQQGVAA